MAIATRMASPETAAATGHAPALRRAGAWVAGRQRQAGHVLVFALAMLLAAALMLMLVFNTGQATAEKARLLNTADAVAFSLATVEARNLNFLAYTNRAIIANQAAIGQLESYANIVNALDVVTHGTEVELSAALHTIAIACAIIPGAQAAAATIEETILPGIQRVLGTAQRLTSALTKAVLPLVKVLVKAAGALETAIYGSQIVVQASMAEALVQTYVAVKNENDPDAKYLTTSTVLSVAETAAELATFVQPAGYAKPADSQQVLNGSTQEGKQYARFTRMIEDARDEFTKRRTLFPFIESLDDILNVLPFSLTPSYSGGTDFGYLKGPRNSYGWQAVDAMALELRFNLAGLYSFKQDLPIGGASFMQTGSDSPTNFQEALLAGEAIRYGGQRAKDPVVQAFWTRAPNSTLKEEEPRLETGALKEARLVSGASLSGVFSRICPTPLMCSTALGQGEFVVLDAQDPLPRSYFDLRRTQKNATTVQLKEYGVDNPDAVDIIDKIERPLDPDPNSDLGPSFVIPLTKPASSLRTAKALGIGAERAALGDDGYIGEGISAISKGQTYFRRPADRWLRKDLAIEHRSLFNPYWHARVVKPSLQERLAYLATWGLGSATGWQ